MSGVYSNDRKHRLDSAISVTDDITHKKMNGTDEIRPEGDLVG